MESDSTTVEQTFLGELRLSRRLISLRQVASTGVVIAFGLAFLLPGLFYQEAGVASSAPIALSAFVLGLTLLNVIELLAGSSERGGTYVLVHESWGGTAGFATGWALFALGITLAVALFQALGAALISAIPVLTPYAPYIPVAALILVVLTQLLGLRPRRNRTWLLLLLLSLGIMVLSLLRTTRLETSTSMPAALPDDFMRAAAWAMLAFAGLEVLLSGRRQIQDPKRHLPQGLLVSLFVGALFIALMQALVNRSGLLPDQAGSTALIALLGGTDPIRIGFAVGFGSITFLIAANNALMVAARQLYVLSRFGALPRGFTKVRRPFHLPPLIFFVLLLFSIPMLWLPTALLLDMGAAAAILVILLLNIAALISRRREPDRRRWFATPLYPLVPALAITACPFLFFGIPTQGLLGIVIWLAIGALIFSMYARTHITEAQQGVLVFGREPLEPKTDRGYRILVPLSPGVERQFVLGLATALAKQSKGEVIPLQVVPISDPLAIQEGRRLAQERNTLFEWSTRDSGPSEVPIHPITRLASSVARGIQDTAIEEECDLILLTWPVSTSHEGTRMGRVLDPVVRNAPCDVAVVAYQPATSSGDEEVNQRLAIHNILVPTAGGPHAPLATRLALLLAREFKASTRTVYVTRPDASEAELAQGRQRIESTLTTMREALHALVSLDPSHEDVSLESVVVQSPSVVEGIIQAGADSDLVFIGASEESLIDQVVFGTLPEQVARACPTPVVMVKSYRGLPRFWLQRLWDSLSQALPKLTLEEQVEVYKRVRRDSRPDTDFFVMMGLAATIATYGLLQGSAAVIIGAMLVAPLFTPILAGSLAVVQGDIRMLRIAVEAALKGIALAIGLAVVLTAISPLRTLTAEIASRTSPNLFDLAVALASGAAGAYAVARKDVATALPGVAIAAALVPPLCVVGVGIAMGSTHVTGGAALLFVTNLIAITLSGSTTLLLLGFRPAAGAEREARLRLGILTSLVLLTAITIPLALIFVEAVQSYKTEQIIQRVVTEQLEPHDAIRLIEFEQTEDGDALVIRTEIQTAGTL
ncbi:MAG: amino acid permease, partial [Anaerolineales bacterium]